MKGMKTHHLWGRRPSWGKKDKKVDETNRAAGDQPVGAVWVLQGLGVGPVKVFSLSFLFHILSFLAPSCSIHSETKVRQRSLKVNHGTAPPNTACCTITIFMRTPADGKTPPHPRPQPLPPLVFASICSSFVVLALFLLAYNEKFGGESPGNRRLL